MKTEELIAVLAADTRPAPGVTQRLARALPAGMVLAVVAFALAWGIREDLAEAMTSPAVLKTVLPLGLALAAGLLALELLRPEGRGGKRSVLLGAFGILLVAGFGAALASGGVPALTRALSTPSLTTCLTSIPLLSVPLIAAVFWAARAGAPQRPALTGALVGLAGGGIAAALYALYCDQDAALFVLPAYGAAIGIVTAASSLIGARLLAW